MSLLCANFLIDKVSFDEFRQTHFQNVISTDAARLLFCAISVSFSFFYKI